ncbi:hypothetical protein AOLI_G00019720 [Acnodon oligacanthus]
MMRLALWSQGSYITFASTVSCVTLLLETFTNSVSHRPHWLISQPPPVFQRQLLHLMKENLSHPPKAWRLQKVFALLNKREEDDSNAPDESKL